MDPVIRCVEPAACPSPTRGEYRYDFGDTIGMTPLLKMHTLGHDFIPDPIHAGGLRYHGMAPLVSHVYELGLAEAEAIPQLECFQAALMFARTQGIVPAPEPTHAIAAAIREANRCKESGESKTILTALLRPRPPRHGAPTRPTSPAPCRTSTSPRTSCARPWQVPSRVTPDSHAVAHRFSARPDRSATPTLGRA